LIGIKDVGAIIGKGCSTMRAGRAPDRPQEE
jgi:hypothetical protein